LLTRHGLPFAAARLAVAQSGGAHIQFSSVQRHRTSRVFEHINGEGFMKFSKPINREVEIDGNHFIVAFDDIGIEFRLKGKRKTARVEWAHVLDIARGEDGEDARALLGLDHSTSAQRGRQEPSRMGQNEDAIARTINPPAPQSQPDGSAQAPPSTASPNQASADTESPDSDTAGGVGELGRVVTAGDIGPES
jgi:hypothetical protein